MKRIALLTGICLLFISCGGDEQNWYGTLHGVVTDYDTQEQLSGANVSLAPGSKSVVTGTDGYFEFKDLEAIQYTLTVQKSGYATNRKTVTAISGEDTEVNISITKNN
ncbi:MAG: carboxypeptidase-like regulatory domain-containing protein [Bacteroidales bacterium]|nr:carboxypeptidase-like regulatory domain-containing protein [Bacteroidales bacterium]